MLYPRQILENCFILIDYNRPHIPLTAYVIVPVHPKKGDMVKVNGTDNEVWLAHVQTMDERLKTCRAVADLGGVQRFPWNPPFWLSPK